MRVHTSTDASLQLAMVELCGPLSRASAPRARRVIDSAAAAGMRHVIVDLSGLDDVDPELALVLLEEDDSLQRSGGWLWLVHGVGNVGSSLRYLGVYPRVPSSPSRAAAGWRPGWRR